MSRQRIMIQQVSMILLLCRFEGQLCVAPAAQLGCTYGLGCSYFCYQRSETARQLRRRSIVFLDGFKAGLALHTEYFCARGCPGLSFCWLGAVSGRLWPLEHWPRQIRMTQQSILLQVKARVRVFSMPLGRSGVMWAARYVHREANGSWVASAPVAWQMQRHENTGLFVCFRNLTRPRKGAAYIWQRATTTSLLT
jgi:hypothetical protein